MELKLKFVEEANQHSFKRKLFYQKAKKITHEILRREIEMNMVLGEVSGAERILDFILTNKKGGTPVEMDDLEAAIHMFISHGLNYVSKTYHGVEAFSIDRVLATHGYYEKEVPNERTDAE